MRLIEQAAPDRDASIVDVGGGASTLVDDLLAQGYHDISVLDISGTAVELAKRRLGEHATAVHWWIADMTEITLPKSHYNVWHDRAVFHFLTSPVQRAAYVRHVLHAVKPGGHVIVATFGPDGPDKCSGLPVVRYSGESLQHEFGSSFELMESFTEPHETPFGTTQQFLYYHCRVGAGVRGSS
jgi:2-polyprenyl-3-methyl-5-hydroxy-6-metoxy-1,4-benzoquinol methylase